jgi:hypothetical protein
MRLKFLREGDKHKTKVKKKRPRWRAFLISLEENYLITTFLVVVRPSTVTETM